MRIVKADQEDLLFIEPLYMRSFPKEERKPFSLILEKEKEGTMKILLIEESGEKLGLAIMVCKAPYVLLDYFAIDEKYHNKGYGSKAITILKELYRTSVFFLEIERTAADMSASDIRIRRKNFYLRNGLTEAFVIVDLFGVEMELLDIAGKIHYDEYEKLYLDVFGEKIKKHLHFISN